ncbi:hypothetical protein PI125_g6816, partial [Phytophthora idaei]
RGIAE